MLTYNLKLAILLDLILKEIDLIFQLIRLLTFISCYIVYLFLFLTYWIKIIFKFFCFGLRSSKFILPIFDIFLTDFNIILKLGDYLFILVYLNFIVLIFCHCWVNLQFLFFKLTNIFIFSLDKIVQAINFLSHQGDFILIIFKENLDVLILV